MKWLNDLLKGLKPEDNKPLRFNTSIKRPKDYKEQFEGQRENIKELFDEMYQFYQLNNLESFHQSESYTVHSQYAAGLILNKPESISQLEFTCLFDDLKDRVSQLSYRLNHSNCQVSEKNGQEEKKEFYYLKPIIRNYGEGKYEQQYGNINIEHNLIDNKSVSITVLCTYYSGFNYSEPQPFESFMEAIHKAA